MNVELLRLVNKVNESDYKNNLSYFRPFAAKIKFSFTSKAYLHSLETYKNGRVISDYLKIIIHEYFHFFQRMFTPYGYYNQLIEQYKIAVAVNIAKYILNTIGRNRKLTAPLIRVIEDDPSLINDDYLTKLLFNWLDASIIYSYINDDFRKYQAMYEFANTIRIDLPIIANKFKTFEGELFEYLQISSRIRGVSLDIFDVRVNVTKSLLESELTNARNKCFNIFPTINGIIESYSKAAELYLDHETLNIDHFRRMSIPAKWQDYYLPLLTASHFIPAKNSAEFLLTYLAICDIALSPPIIPHLHQSRNNHSLIESIDPSYRFYLLLNHQRYIKPIHTLDNDYDRYVNELCGSLNWITPQTIAKKVVSTLQVIDGDLASCIFYASQNKRSLILRSRWAQAT